MELKTRLPSKELQIFNSLSPRFELSDKDRQYHYSLKKGYEGEVKFDKILEDQLQCECLIIKDLLLTIDTNTFQIDTLIIFPSIIEFFEVKNFEGEHFYDKDKDKFYKNQDYEIQNPEHQMSRAETLLRKLLRRQGFNVSIKGTVVFINSEFTLYNAPTDKPFILPTQINLLMRKLNRHTTKITKQHKSIAQNLISLHENEYPIKKVPTYEYFQLKKGITCQHCRSLSISVQGHYYYCKKCGEKDRVADAVIRCVQDFKILFPDEKITTAKIYDWCGGFVSKQRTKRILMKHFQIISKRRWSYYE